mgnify:CR=1 FL=1
MKFYKYSIHVIVIVVFAISCTDFNGPVDRQVSLDEKIGQMLMVGFRGLSVNESNQVAQDIRLGRIGGVVLYDRDVALASDIRNIQSPLQLKTLINSLQNRAKIPLFVAIDQEGGRVNRLKERYGFPATVSQEYLGKLNNPDSTKYYADRIANTLRTLGININFAPVVDVNINPKSPAIGNIERSFSVDPNVVINHSKVAIGSYNSLNIFTALKHFPGHGSAANDSHHGFTDVTSTWQEIELEPYRELIKKGYKDFVMTAHIFNSNLDPEYPATLSKKIMTGILRERLGFEGVIISDDMNMGAIADNYGLETAVRKSIEAGVDILLFANNLSYDEKIAEKVIAIIKRLISQRIINVNRIDESYDRIMKMKRSMQTI